jgi:hypothetical protein
MISSMLKRDNQVLWAAERERPDFAGKEGDDNFFDSMATTDEMVREPGPHFLSALPDRGTSVTQFRSPSHSCSSILRW